MMIVLRSRSGVTLLHVPPSDAQLPGVVTSKRLRPFAPMQWGAVSSARKRRNSRMLSSAHQTFPKYSLTVPKLVSEKAFTTGAHDDPLHHCPRFITPPRG